MSFRDNTDARISVKNTRGMSEGGWTQMREGKKTELISSGRLIGPVGRPCGEQLCGWGAAVGGTVEAESTRPERELSARHLWPHCGTTAPPSLCARRRPTAPQPMAVTSARHAEATAQQYTLFRQPVNIRLLLYERVLLLPPLLLVLGIAVSSAILSLYGCYYRCRRRCCYTATITATATATATVTLSFTPPPSILLVTRCRQTYVNNLFSLRPALQCLHEVSVRWRASERVPVTGVSCWWTRCRPWRIRG